MSKKTEKKHKDKGIKIISSPLNFQHRVHVGADGVNIEELQALFDTSGKTVNKPIETVNAPEVSQQEPSKSRIPGANTLKNVTPPPPCQSRDVSSEGGVSAKDQVFYNFVYKFSILAA